MEQTGIQTQLKETNNLAVSNYNRVRQALRQPDVMSKFAEVLGQYQAGAYVASVLIAVANNKSLQECTIASIVTAAMRAATLRLSCDPATGHAYLVPFKGRATLIIGYKGMQHMALRTGKYRYLNIAKVREGEVVEEDWLTGVHKLTGKRISEKVVAYCLYFELFSGFSKSFYMSIEEIHAHAQQYSKSYGRTDSPWTTHPANMEQKTMIRLGLGRWGYFDPHDAMFMAQVDDNDEEDEKTLHILDGEESAAHSEHENLAALGFENDETPANTAEKKQTQEPAPAAAPQEATDQAPGSRPFEPENLRTWLIEQSKIFQGQAANGKRNEVAACLSHVLGGDKRRAELQKFLFGKTSLKEIGDPLVIAVHSWLAPQYDKNQGIFLADPIAAKEAAAAHAFAQKASGQAELPLK